MTTYPAPIPAGLTTAPTVGWRTRVAKAKSGAMAALCALSAVAILAVLGLVVGYLVSVGVRSLSIDFFTRLPTYDAADPGGLKQAIVGTLVLIALASAVGIPTGMLAGVYLSEYEADGWLAAPTRFVCDVLAGVPSIVVGILGYELLVRPIGSYNVWAGALALAFIMVPIVARTTEEMLRLVPGSYREASVALGASKAKTILAVVLPSATGSVVTGVMLAIARVAGETAPLLFTAGISRFMPIAFNEYGIPNDLNVDQPFPSLTVAVYDFAQNPSPEIRGMAWAGAIVLIALIFVLNLAIRFFTSRRRRA